MEHLSQAERVAIGKAARRAVPRSRHAEFEPAVDRPDPIGLLERQATSRVLDLIPIRYGRMLVSPFAFYRGAALIMASDLSRTPVSGIRVQLCGDAHLSNFGVFASPERQLMFDLNDFDETLPGPWEWDVKRLAASLAVAGRENRYQRRQRERIVRDMALEYRTAIRAFAASPNLAVWYARLDLETELETWRSQFAAKAVRRTEANIAKARTRDSMRAFQKLTRIVDGEPRIIGDPPLIVPVEEVFPEATAEQLTESVREFIRGYRGSLQTDRRALLEQFRFVHLARKVVGVGSVGTRAWIALFLGLDSNDPLFLQVKEAQPSVLEEFAGGTAYANAGERVVAGQHVMQAASDIFLGWRRMTNPLEGVERDFYVRQLKDWKGSAEVEGMPPENMAAYARMCGWTLARAHSRSGDRVALAAYLGAGDTFDRALAQFAEAYADQNESDYEALDRAVKSGRIEAQLGL
ncbi:MAG TPA: DUF2252 domain-containing protein [Solirubrobacteraceae bacterium]|nr:DUF2252 domain-containing protein [Solirubrobacteraceae bacterium]